MLIIQRRADLARLARADPTDATVAARLGAVELELTKATQAMTARMPPRRQHPPPASSTNDIEIPNNKQSHYYEFKAL